MMAKTEETYDVAIVGAGPSGLMCAVWLARRGVKVAILEKRTSRPARGRADGFEPRTLEILDSFGLLDSWWRKANHTVELSVWVASHKQNLERILRRCNSARGTSRFYEATMDQAVIELAMEEYLAREHGVFVQYATECLSLEVDAASREDESFPVILSARRNDQRQPHTIRSRYLVGADGSRSWTRNHVGIQMEGSRTARYWGVADITPLSNFPDIRNRCIIHQEDKGTVMTIPREAGMVRLYVQLGETVPMTSSGEPFGSADIIQVAQDIMHPYTLDYRSCYWSSTYRVEQTLASSFSAFDRVFLLGDAIHTHSPKAGQGLNVSIQDANNLGWKLAAVINGEAHPSLLKTYEKDRRPVAQFLVEFDQNFQQFFHEPLTQMNWTIDQYRAAFSEAVNVEHVELSGISATYIDEYMMEDPRHSQQQLAPGIPIGRRLPDAVVSNQADGRAWHIQDLLPSTGSWRLLVFAGDLRDDNLMRRYRSLGRSLASNDSPLKSFQSTCPDVPFMEIITIHSSPRHSVDLLDLPDIFHPWNENTGWDYDKIFTDDEMYHESHGQAYRKFDMCPKRGCALLVRPDQHVCLMMEIENAVDLTNRYLRSWLCGRQTTKQIVIENSDDPSEMVARL